MRNTCKKTLRVVTIATATAMLVTILGGAAHAQGHPWTSVGSTGVVDETDTGIVEFVLGEARVSAGAAAGSVLNLRYNVVSLEDLTGLGFFRFDVRFRDNGTWARVQLDLRQYDANTGVTSTLHSFDSNAYPAAVGYQKRSECFGIDWDFIDGPFYIEATLTKSGAAGQPALGTIQIIPSNCEL
jgi:hypothetical protein